MMNFSLNDGQHYLLSAQARTLSVAKVARLSDLEAYETFKSIRWSENGGNPVCPHCGAIECWTYTSRKIFKCKHCEKQFSVTSGTIFANRKLPIRDYLLAIAVFVNAHKGISALQMSRDLGVQYKTAFVLAHKLRESIGNGLPTRKLTGTIEVDGAYFGGYIKPKNKKKDRIDRRLWKNQNGKRRCVFVIRERQGQTRPVVILSESAASVSHVMKKHIDTDATVHADENPAYDVLHSTFNIRRINHSLEYSSAESCTNGAEGWFSRLRRGEIGQYHHMAGKHLLAYANEMAFREDYRRTDNGSALRTLLDRCLKSSQSRTWCGYWQGNKRDKEILAYS